MSFAWAVPLYLLLLFGNGNSAKLNVFIEAKEVSRFLYDINKDLYLVKGGRVANLLRTSAFTSLVPPIRSNVKNIKFKFNSNGKILYKMKFRSSNESVMVHPRASIPLRGRVPRKTKGFRISFPCTGRLSGRVILNISIMFHDQKRRKIVWGPLQLSLRRQCRSNQNRRSARPTGSTGISSADPTMCNKKCNKQHILQRFCFSDYVIRAKVESVIRKKGGRYLRVRVIKTFKKGKVKINRRQLIKVRSLKVTCKCTRLLPRKTYLILSKEDRHKRKLYIDELTTALEWSNDAKRYLRIHRKKAVCPLRARPSK